MLKEWGKYLLCSALGAIPNISVFLFDSKQAKQRYVQCLCCSGMWGIGGNGMQLLVL
ncbi:hypothetical protein JCM19233_6548 [Vibrio astriarenae]|nr:hypothetical protein JCM19233_6548 [Vibrio sp. C7]